MWGCLGKFLTLMTVLVLLGMVAVATLGVVTAVAIPHVVPQTVTASVPGFDATAEMRLTSAAEIAALRMHDPYRAFGMNPGEWIFLSIITLCVLLTAVLLAGMIGFYRHNRRREPDEARETVMMQELHHLALRMDERIESLETLLLGHGRGKN